MECHYLLLIIRLLVITLLAPMNPMQICQWSQFCSRTMFPPLLKALFQWISLFRSILQTCAFWVPILLARVPIWSPFHWNLGPHRVPILKKVGPHANWEQCKRLFIHPCPCGYSVGPSPEFGTLFVCLGRYRAARAAKNWKAIISGFVQNYFFK